MSLTFSLDTTSPNCSIAVLEDRKLLAEYNFFSSGELSETLVSYIDSLFSSLKIGVDDIGLIGVSTGPGLFTGIRVGLVTLKGIFFNRAVSVVPVNSLEAAAEKLIYTGKTIVPVLDARREEIYIASYHVSSGFPACSVEPTLIKAEELKSLLKEEANICFTGSGISVYRDLLINDFPGSSLVERSPFIAGEVGQIALKEFEAGNYLKQIDTLEPMYIRIPDAEKNFNKGKG